MDDLAQKVIYKHKYILSKYEASIIPHPSVWRHVLEAWPNSLRQHWANMAEKYQESGLSWQESEWRSFRFFASDTLRFLEDNPTKSIPWRTPTGPYNLSLAEDNSVLADQLFLSDLRMGAELNAISRTGRTWRRLYSKPSKPRTKKKKFDDSMGKLNGINT